MAYPSIDDLKLFLRISPNPSFEPDELDALLTELLAAAVAHVETATGDTFSDATPERISLAVKFLAAYWFENPMPDSKGSESALDAVNLLVTPFKNFTFPG